MPEEQGVHVWAVTQQSDRPVAKHHWAEWPLASLTSDIARLRQPLEALGETGLVRPFPEALARQFYQKLIAPLGGELMTKPQWIVAASGPLARIPFSLLQIEPAQSGKPAQWLIDRVALTHVPSVGSWLNLRALPRNVKPSETLLAWGDPVFKPEAPTQSNHSNGSVVRAVRSTTNTNADLDKDLAAQENIYHDIPPLPETREELLQLAKALKANPEDLVLGNQATRQNVLNANKSGAMQRKKILVFATHGLMSGDLPGLSQPALAMSANGEESRNPLAPLLTLEDVLGLKLNSDWVVLSACNTAAGDGKAEEALSGLARGFFYAGSRALLVTHWAVESDSAKELTTRTFAHFSTQSESPKAESLRQAILQVKSDSRYSHPVFWAPYVLVGDSNR
jgi:CHAT domain-containing protein